MRPRTTRAMGDADGLSNAYVLAQTTTCNRRRPSRPARRRRQDARACRCRCEASAHI
jgi:hypothetical protein